MEATNDILSAKFKKSYAVKSSFNADYSVKDVDTIGRVVTGFYNTFNFLDSDGDILLSGSAKRSIMERGPKSNASAKIKHALFHDLTRLAGRIQVLEEKTIDGVAGIYFETKMSDTIEGNDTLKNYLEKVYDNHSIGFQYLDVEHINRQSKNWEKVVNGLINPKEADMLNDMFLVKDIKLYEGSTVAFGANSLTPFLGIKSGNKDSLKLALKNKTMQIGKQLSGGTQSDEQMQVFELQLLQLNQMIDELVDEIPFGKSSVRQDEQKKEVVDSGIDYKFLLNKF